jgi:hypothetical protein
MLYRSIALHRGPQEKLVKYRLAAASAICALSLAPFFGCSSTSDVPSPDMPMDGGMPDATVFDVAPIDDAASDVVDAPDEPDVAMNLGGPCDLDSQGEPAELRCTGLYSDWPSRTIAPGVHVFDPGLHLWSDGAVKTRWISLPPGTVIDTTNMDEWKFPVGTKLWKQFVVNGELIETRLIHKVANGAWYPTTYQWSGDGGATSELTSGELNANDAGYEIPSQFKCMQCHQGRADFVLGFEAVSLSSPGASGMTIQDLENAHLLSAPPTAPLTVPGNAVESAALGYLHTNCGITCHNPGGGLANTTGFFMRLEASKLGSVQATDTYTTGWNVETLGFKAVPDRLSQCSPATSCVYYRMSHRDLVADASVGTQMPPIDTHQIDPTGLATVAAWINEGCDAGADAGD